MGKEITAVFSQQFCSFIVLNVLHFMFTEYFRKTNKFGVHFEIYATEKERELVYQSLTLGQAVTSIYKDDRA